MNTERDDQGSKVPDFCNKMDDLYHEMVWQGKLQKRSLLFWFSRNFATWRTSSFYLAMVINLLIIMCYPLSTDVDPDTGRKYYSTTGAKIVALIINLLSLAQLGNAVVVVICYLGNYGMLMLMKGHLYRDLKLWYHVAYLLCCFLGLVHNQLLFSLLLLDVI
eukprot:Colp12_sorted_trinity150504_noHs@20608